MFNRVPGHSEVPNDCRGVARQIECGQNNERTLVVRFACIGLGSVIKDLHPVSFNGKKSSKKRHAREAETEITATCAGCPLNPLQAEVEAGEKRALAIAQIKERLEEVVHRLQLDRERRAAENVADPAE